MGAKNGAGCNAHSRDRQAAIIPKRPMAKTTAMPSVSGVASRPKDVRASRLATLARACVAIALVNVASRRRR